MRLTADQLLHEKDRHIERVMSTQLSAVGFPLWGVLGREGVHTLGDLSRMTRRQLVSVRGIGKSKADTIERTMKRYGLKLRQ